MEVIMALHNVDVTVEFTDAGPLVSTVTYPLLQQYDDTDPGSMSDVFAAAVLLIDALNVLTWDKITGYQVQVNLPGGGAAPNIAANNSVYAFTRCVDQNDEPCGFQVPAWDDDTFDKNTQNMLSDAYNAAAQDVADLLANRGIGGYRSQMGAIQWTQNRGHKTRNKVS